MLRFIIFTLTIIFIFLASGSCLWWYELRRRNIPHVSPRPADTDEDMLDDIASSVGIKAFLITVFALVFLLILYYSR